MGIIRGRNLLSELYHLLVVCRWQGIGNLEPKFYNDYWVWWCGCWSCTFPGPFILIFKGSRNYRFIWDWVDWLLYDFSWKNITHFLETMLLLNTWPFSSHQRPQIFSSAFQSLSLLLFLKESLLSQFNGIYCDLIIDFLQLNG